MKKTNALGVVIKSTKYRDSDKIYTLFTREYGKISAIARGVRKISSRRAGNLDSMNLVKLSLSEEKTGIRKIDEASSITSFKDLKKTYDLSVKCSYVMELVYKTVEEEGPQQKVFDLLVKFLKLAEKYPNEIDTAVIFFEINFLLETGYGINLESCIKCGKKFEKLADAPSAKFTLDLTLGGFLCPDCQTYGLSCSGRAVNSLYKFTKNKISKLSKTDQKEMSSVTSALIDEYLGIRLKSRELL